MCFTKGDTFWRCRWRKKETKSLERLIGFLSFLRVVTQSGPYWKYLHMFDVLYVILLCSCYYASCFLQSYYFLLSSLLFHSIIGVIQDANTLLTTICWHSSFSSLLVTDFPTVRVTLGTTRSIYCSAVAKVYSDQRINSERINEQSNLQSSPKITLFRFWQVAEWSPERVGGNPSQEEQRLVRWWAPNKWLPEKPGYILVEWGSETRIMISCRCS